MNTTQNSIAENKSPGWQAGILLRFSAIIIVSTGSFLWVRHYSHVFDSVVHAHLGDNTYMVPLVDPLRWRIHLGEFASTASFFFAGDSRSRSPRSVALAVFLFSVVALVATIFIAP